ncbi:hypothetical protein H5410_018223 [Solanum commersonii]|uniref:Strictosidine synthase conserved region domain-containing protein n=1 Tax=Solanum commersonii TaxID=4109 RepID=A0A9J6A2R0_SOLCO|nr:hypothetical protein H5410_018223 [Solanum commersonii]
MVPPVLLTVNFQHLGSSNFHHESLALNLLLSIKKKKGDGPYTAVADGRIVKYEVDAYYGILVVGPTGGLATQLVTSFEGPVGLSLSKDSSYVLITEYIAQRIRRFWLKGPKANSSDVFRKVEGIPDNIRRTVLGDFWEAIANTKQNITYSIGQRINQLGKVVKTRHFTAQCNDTPLGITLVKEYKGKLYVGSLDQNFIGVYRAYVGSIDRNFAGVYTV